MMSRSRRGNNPVSLFPFLAVLVCVLGGLILLLVVNTRRMRMQGEAEAAARQLAAAPQTNDEPVSIDETYHQEEVGIPPAAPIVVDEPDDEPEEEFETPAPPARDLAAERAAREQQIAEQWQQISDLEDRLHEITAQREEKLAARNKLESLLEKTEARLAAGSQAVGELDRTLRQTQDEHVQLARETTLLDGEYERLTRHMQQLRRELEIAKTKQADVSNRYAFVPYNGKKGTSRRPILIECSEQYIRFLPEDVRLTPRELNGFTPNVNPLLTGVRTLSAYWRAWHRLHPEPGVEDEPYVMLIVRPSGSVAYYIARKFLGGLNEPYGYELVSADWELALPDADPRAKQECEAAIIKLLKERDQIRRELESQPFLEEQPITLDQPQNRFNVDDVDQVAPRKRGSSDSTFDPNSPVSVKPTISRRDEEALPGGFGEASRRPLALEQPPGRFPASPDDRALRPGERSGRGGLADPSGDSLSDASAVPPAPTTPQPIADDKRNDLTPFDGVQEFNSIDDAHPDLADQPIRPGDEDHFGQLKTDSIVPRLDDHDRQTGELTDITGSEYKFGDEIPILDGDRKTFGPPAHAPRGPQGSKTASAGDARGNSRNGRTSPSSSTASGAGGSAEQAGPGNPLVMDFTKPERRAGQRVDTRRWGSPAADASIGFERELSIGIREDRIVIGGTQIPAARTEVSRKEFEDAVIGAIDQTVRSWPRPPAGFYWVPKVHFRVAPGGSGRYEQLNNELRDLGLSTVATHESGGRP